MSSSNSVSSTLSALSSSYTAYETEEEDPLGREAFLTMLVAQLENQDPLNPAEGTDFTAQLAQFSSLEQEFAINDNLEEIISVLSSSTETNLTGYIGTEVSAEINSLVVSSGEASTSGYFDLSEETGVLVAIYNEDGELVTSLNYGTLEAGEYSVSWDCQDSDGETVDDGTYYYEVMALNDSGGYSYSISTTISGEVDGIVYEDGVGYLVIGDTMFESSDIVEVRKASDTESASETTDDTSVADSTTDDTTEDTSETDEEA